MKKICVIGGGRWGENHIRTLSQMGNLGAVVDMNAARLSELKEKYGMAVYTDLEDAIAHGYDGYVVSTSALNFDRKAYDHAYRRVKGTGKNSRENRRKLYGCAYFAVPSGH